MYAAGLGLQVSPLNPFLKHHYSNLKGEKLNDALVNTLGSINNWKELITAFNERLSEKNTTEAEKEVLLQSIEDTEYQINTAEEIVKLIHSAITKERIENERKN